MEHKIKIRKMDKEAHEKALRKVQGKDSVRSLKFKPGSKEDLKNFIKYHK